MKKLLLISIFILTTFCAFAAEKILNFDVSLILDDKAHATITEEISVNTEHIRIKRGIYRNIPQSRLQKVKVQSLEMDGQPHPYFTKKNGDNLSISFGDDNYITPGQHKYKLTYTMDNAVIFGDDYDQIYWNVTGNYWQFPIESASFRIALPNGTKIIKEGVSIYTGKYGERGTNAQALGSLYFETTKPLKRHEGFTVAIPFKKGAIELSLYYKIIEFFKNIMPIILALILLIYCIMTWLKYGKDPKFDDRVLYAPPTDISPAFARYILRRQVDIQSFSTALVSLAVKERIAILDTKKTIELERLTQKNKDLPPEEAYLMSNLFSNNYLSIKNNKHQQNLSNAFNKLQAILENEGKPLIQRNFKYIIAPFVLLLLMQIPISMPTIAINIFLMIFLAAFSVGRKLPFAFIIILILFAFGSSSVLESYLSISQTVFVISLTLTILFMYFMDNTSQQGREVYLNVLGFKKYMDSAEKHRAQASNPEDKLKIFADFLPYAYAFGIESQWINKFTKLLSAELVNSHLDRYGGSRLYTQGRLAGTISKATTQRSPRGGGGSFGSGYSGGGFGGGGGGGR